ncbi:hypothetical protein ANOM_005233 [Aspergillus nomiae NRRL 13137]|uniref:Alcohol dehydrogenase n=1 Tax=Aspergillus nomiae NRRL (strain ATCC 15546 / NRRL 13137 / CBS 260.88 / M93) TaxID=1509407 RepID=A0A0L1J542_ASPN3|nr:uncharacterized protein ANOM_005233 [Aspergillus nomiae NRRL 13137]KNG86528.1 hypothetical protein ANOM_005233 [Aspergillus nomiae NRRL 13137]
MATVTDTGACQALVLHGAKDLRMGTKPVTAPTGSEVQVAIRATGLCGSDFTTTITAVMATSLFASPSAWAMSPLAS